VGQRETASKTVGDVQGSALADRMLFFEIKGSSKTRPQFNRFFYNRMGRFFEC
jgi:hypothetical protein